MRLLTAVFEFVGTVVGGFVEFLMIAFESVHTRLKGRKSNKQNQVGS